MVSYFVPWLFSLFWAQCAHAQSNPHVRKDTRPSPALPYCKRRKAGRGLGTRLITHHTIPYHIISYHTIPYHTISYHNIPHHTIPHHIIPYHIIPYHTIPYHTIPYHTIPYHNIPNHIISYHTIPYHTMPPVSQICVVSYFVPWLFSLFWAQCAHAQSNPHVRKDTRPSPALPYCKRRKAGRGLGTRLITYHTIPYHIIPYHTIPYHIIP